MKTLYWKLETVNN